MAIPSADFHGIVWKLQTKINGSIDVDVRVTFDELRFLQKWSGVLGPFEGGDAVNLFDRKIKNLCTCKMKK